MEGVRVGNLEGEFLGIDIGSDNFNRADENPIAAPWRVKEAISVNVHATDDSYRKALWIAVYAAVRSKPANDFTDQGMTGWCMKSADAAVKDYDRRWNR